MTLLHVPVIDLTPYREGTPEGKAAVAEKVGQACQDIGFLVVSGHGIPEDLIRRTYDLSKEFFQLSFEEKMKADRPAPDQVRGYSAVGGEGLSYSLDEPTPPDLKESLSIGPVNVPAGDSYFTREAAGPHFAPNVWPAKPADLKQVWIDYFQAVDSLATDLMRLFALALKLDENYFDKTIDKNMLEKVSCLVDGLAGALGETLAEHITSAEIAALLLRARVLLAHPVMPGPDRHRPIPWPAF